MTTLHWQMVPTWQMAACAACAQSTIMRERRSGLFRWKTLSARSIGIRKKRRDTGMGLCDLPIWLNHRAILRKWGNELRQTYHTIAQTASIAELDVHLLMNHSVANVNAGYITRSRLLNDHLRRQQEIISRKILETSGGNPKAHLSITPEWPFLPANRVIEDILKTQD